jgi:hypothetical protein
VSKYLRKKKLALIVPGFVAPPPVGSFDPFDCAAEAIEGRKTNRVQRLSDCPSSENTETVWQLTGKRFGPR